MKRLGLILCLLGALAMFTVSGCANYSNTAKGTGGGALGGAAVGALMGQIIGGNTQSTVLGTAAGAAVGAVVGSIMGNMMDRQAQEMSQALANSQAVSVQRQGDTLSLAMQNDFTFAVDSASIKPSLNSDLDRIAQVLMNYPETTIGIEGHTDSTGSAAHNQDLSLRRANSVKNALVQRGVSSYRISTAGYGADYPIADNSTASGRQLNRRVNIHINPVAQ